MNKISISTPKIRALLQFSLILVLFAALIGPGIRPALAAQTQALPLSPCTGLGSGTVTCDLWATTGSVSIAGGSVPIWGYATASGGTPSLPGPVLIANQGDTVTINLTNELAESTGILFDGQQMVPDTVGAVMGETKPYTFSASQPGTFLYEASPLLSGGSAHQAAMGLYGTLVVLPTTAGQAYNDSNFLSAFNDEFVLVLSELDLDLNSSANPAGFDLRNYHPEYYLVNGQVGSGAAAVDVHPGDRVLLRMVNAGLQAHSMSVLGLTQNVIAVDGSPFIKEDPNNPGSFLLFPRKYTADTIFSGQTSDVIVNIPAGAVNDAKYVVYDADFTLTGGGGAFGGMFAVMNVLGTPPVDDTVGPVTSAVTVSPDKIGIAPNSVTLSANLSDSTTGGNGVADAEYFIGTVGDDGTGTYFSITSTDPVNVSTNVDVSTWLSGKYTFYVHGQDALGNWGSFNTAVLKVDRAGPVIFSLELEPNPSDGSSVLLHATADDRGLGDSLVSSLTYTVDGNTTVLTPDTTAATTFYFMDVLTAGVGTHTITAFATDELGNVGPTASIDMVVDLSGPVTSNVTATPSATDGITPQFNSTIAAIRITAGFTDGTSNISKAEGFITPMLDVSDPMNITCSITAPGAAGTGFVFTSTDGVFDSLSETGFVDIPLGQFWILKQACGSGSYTIHVHAQDASGNWGAFNSTTTVTVP